MGMSGSLDELVTEAAAELMAATADNDAAISERVIADLVSHFHVDFGFLRHNDHTIHATVLIAEWPGRESIPDPDPLRVVYFADADPVFAVAENLKSQAFCVPRPRTPTIKAMSKAARASPPSPLRACQCFPESSLPAPWASSSTGTVTGYPRS